MQFFETSALTGHNVEKMFTALATTIKHKRIDEFENNGGAATAGAAAEQNGSAGDANRPINLGAKETAENTRAPSGCC